MDRTFGDRPNWSCVYSNRANWVHRSRLYRDWTYRVDRPKRNGSDRTRLDGDGTDRLYGSSKYRYWANGMDWPFSYWPHGSGLYGNRADGLDGASKHGNGTDWPQRNRPHRASIDGYWAYGLHRMDGSGFDGDWADRKHGTNRRVVYGHRPDRAYRPIVFDLYLEYRQPDNWDHLGSGKHPIGADG